MERTAIQHDFPPFCPPRAGLASRLVSAAWLVVGSGCLAGGLLPSTGTSPATAQGQQQGAGDGSGEASDPVPASTKPVPADSAEPTPGGDPGADGSPAAGSPTASPLDGMKNRARRLQNIQSGLFVGFELNNQAVQLGIDKFLATAWTAKPAAGGGTVLQPATVPGGCLGPAPNSMAPGSPVCTLDCTVPSADNHAWIGTGTAEKMVLRHRDSGLCLGVGEPKDTPGTALTLAKCEEIPPQLWKVAEKTERQERSGATFVANAGIRLTRISAEIEIPALPSVQQASGVLVAGTPLEGLANGGPEVGVLVAWGAICSPPANVPAFSSWWAAGAKLATKDGCEHGDALVPKAGDTLRLELTPAASSWDVKVTNLRDGQAVSYHRDLALSADAFQLEPSSLSRSKVGAVTIKNISLTADGEDLGLCEPSLLGTMDTIAAATLSPDNRTCTISSITLRPAG